MSGYRDSDTYEAELRGKHPEEIVFRALELAAHYFGVDASRLEVLPFKAEPTEVVQTGEGGWYPVAMCSAIVTVRERSDRNA